MHINADYVYMEIIKNGRPAKSGETGEVVITPLYSYGMPLIRYRVGDLAVADERDKTTNERGLPTVKRIIGRTSDMFTNTQGELFHGEYFTHLFYNQTGVKQFQIIQPNRQNLVINLVPDSNFDPQATEMWADKIRKFVGPLEILWNLVDEIPASKSGKRAFTISHVPIQWSQ